MKEVNEIEKSKEKDSNIYPFIDDLVDSLFTDELNNIINKNTEQNIDKSVFMMFINIYFMAYLHTQKNSNISNEEKKVTLKKLLTEVIRNPEKRQICVSLIKQINPLFNIEYIENLSKLEYKNLENN
jgi:hypothetical protein